MKVIILNLGFERYLNFTSVIGEWMFCEERPQRAKAQLC